MKFVHVRAAQNHMATTFRFLLSCPEGEARRALGVLHDAHALVAALENELTEFREISPIFQLNHAPPMQEVRVPPSVLELLRRAKRLSQISGGAFDPTVKSAQPGWGNFEWDRARSVVWKKNHGAHLSFGAIGKGFALDRVRVLLEQNGFHDFCLTAGGSSIILSGFSAPGEPWEWAWSWKHSVNGESLGVNFIHSSGIPVALGISGFQKKGAHIIDPQTRRQAGLSFSKSALVALPCAADADALSTAFYVGGWEKSLESFQDLSYPPALALIDENEVPHWNGSFQELFGSLEEKQLEEKPLEEKPLEEKPMEEKARLKLAAALPIVLLFFQSGFALAQETVDLSALGLEEFTPYVVERDPLWMLLPLAAIALVLLHLKKLKPRIKKPLEGKKGGGL